MIEIIWVLQALFTFMCSSTQCYQHHHEFQPNQGTITLDKLALHASIQMQSTGTETAYIYLRKKIGP